MKRSRTIRSRLRHPSPRRETGRIDLPDASRRPRARLLAGAAIHRLRGSHCIHRFFHRPSIPGRYRRGDEDPAA